MTSRERKALFGEIAVIAIPIALQNFISFATGMLDTLMLGRADGKGVMLSAASLANQPFFLLSLVCFGLSGAATVLTAQYWGKGDMKTIRSVISMTVKLSAGFSLVFGAAAVLFPVSIMKIYSSVPEVIEAGAQYLGILGYAYFFFGVSSTMICVIRSVELVKVSVAVNISSMIINGTLNYALIYGNFGFPALGIRGAAIATLTARLMEFVVTYVYIFFIDKRLSFRIKDFLLHNGTLFHDLVRFGSPVFANEVLWAVAISVQAAVLGHITYTEGDPVAANSIAGMVQQLATVFIFGISNAATVIIGKAIGEKDIPKARARSGYLVKAAVIVGIIAAAAIWLMKTPVVGFYDVPETTKLLARQMLDVVAINTFFVSLSCMTIMGILRGAGDTKFCLVSEMSALWCVATPAAAIAAFVLQLPVPAVLAVMKIDEVIKAVVCSLRIRGNRWIKSTTRDVE